MSASSTASSTAGTTAAGTAAAGTSGWRDVTAALLIYLGLSILSFGRALGGGLSSFYVGVGPDPPQSIWFLAWWAHALANRVNPLSHARGMGARRLQPRLDDQHPARGVADASGNPHARRGGRLQHSLPALPRDGWMGGVRDVPPRRARVRAGAVRRLRLRFFAVPDLQAARQYRSCPGPDAAAGCVPHVARAGRNHAQAELHRAARAGALRAIFALHRDLRDDDDERRDCDRDRAAGD